MGNITEQKVIKGKTITKTILHPPGAEDKLAFILDNVFSVDECNEWIKLSEDNGYEEALVNVGGGAQVHMPDFRNNMRSIIDSIPLTDYLMEYIKPFLPQVWKNKPIVGLNERLRFLKYDPGEKFAPHFDGMYIRPGGEERSYITIQLYLNEGFKGGSTTFIGKNERLEVVPKIGRVLVFEHRIYHEGSALIEGRKYACRTDVMYNVQTVV